MAPARGASGERHVPNSYPNAPFSAPSFGYPSREAVRDSHAEKAACPLDRPPNEPDPATNPDCPTPPTRPTELRQLIDRRRYFVLHAPRQTGKTSALLALQDLLNAEGRYRCVYVNVEAGQAMRENVTAAP